VSASSTRLQYRVDLTTVDRATTPALNDVTIGFVTSQPPVAVDDSATFPE